jgi:hypothetical protein
VGEHPPKHPLSAAHLKHARVRGERDVGGEVT